MSQSPLVSCVMSVFNGKRYLADAVESILSQTFTDFEFVVIDDGSTDTSPRLLERYAAADSRLRLTRRPNTGLTRALNEGLRLARGEFVARMDGDDVAERTRFERQVAFLRQHADCVAVGCALQLLDPDGAPLAEQRPPTTHEAIVARLLQGEGAVPHPSAMIRRSALLAVGGYREDFPAAQDLDLWLRLSEFGRLANLGEILLRYRLHADSVTARRRTQQLACAERAVREALLRRGQPVPGRIQLPDAKPSSPARTLRGSARMAWRSGHVSTARKHAWAAFQAAPWCCSNLGLLRLLLPGRH